MDKRGDERRARPGERAGSPLAGKRIVVTRAAAQCRSICEALREKGAKPVSLPLIEIAPPADYGPLDGAIRALPSFQWLVLTSQNAVHALAERSAMLGIELAGATRATAVAVVGPATAEAAEQAGLRAGYVAAQHSGLALAQELRPQVAGKRVLIPRSELANDELPRLLTEAGAEVTCVIAYQNLPTSREEVRARIAAMERPIDAILFFSPSAVHNLEKIYGIDRLRGTENRAVVAAIGPATAKALEELCVGDVAVAKDATPASILRELEQYWPARHPAGAHPR